MSANFKSGLSNYKSRYQGAHSVDSSSIGGQLAMQSAQASQIIDSIGNKPPRKGLMSLKDSKKISPEETTSEDGYMFSGMMQSFKSDADEIKEEVKLANFKKSDSGGDTQTDFTDFDISQIELATVALRNVESRGSGGYTARGPVVKKGSNRGDRAAGAYQVMPKNIPSWTKEHVGKEMTVQEFLNDPQAQDIVVENELAKNFEKYGKIEDAISVWFTGRPLKKAKRANASDGSVGVSEYLSRWSEEFDTLVEKDK
mgnify:FL=1